MISKNANALLFICAVLLSSCTTYHISTQSLMQQLANTQKEKKVNVLFVPPLFFPGVVNGNNLRELKCLDEQDKEHVIRVTNHTGIRITKKDNTRCTFYFDTLLLKDSTINGAKSHFLGLSIKPIKLDDISKMELQQ